MVVPKPTSEKRWLDFQGKCSLEVKDYQNDSPQFWMIQIPKPQKHVFGQVPYFFGWHLDFQGLYTSTFKGLRKMVPGYRVSILRPLGFDLHLFEGPGIWVFAKIGLPQNGWFIKENPINSWMTWGEFSSYFRKHPYRKTP